MNKKLILSGCLALSAMSYAQQNLVMQYPEELYQYNGSGSNGGTARFQGLSGAMGALGGDLSATTVNPAGAAVFLSSEAAITGGLTGIKYERGDNGDDYKDSQFNLDQLGAVMVFDELNSADWRNVAIAMNYQRQNTVNEAIHMSPNTNGVDRVLTDFYTEREGYSTLTNLSVAANLRDRYYFGGGVNFHTFESNNFEAIGVDDLRFTDNYTYIKDYTPNSRLASGVSANLGVIAKVNQMLRLGLAYHSPAWYVDTEELVTEYAMYEGTDNEGDKYYIDRDVYNYINDLTTNQKVTASAAMVLGANGLISADYTYTDYSPAKYKPENEFAAENDFIENQLSGTSTFRVGAEGRFNDFRVRGGFRYEQTPFEEIDITGSGVTYQPFGDLTGFSVGAGYEFDALFIDAAYGFYSRDRNYLIAGNYYDFGSSIGQEGITQEEALDYLSLNAGSSGFQQTVKDITERQGNFSLTVGFRF